MEQILTAELFAQETWGQVDLGDKRLNRRAVQIGARMVANPEASLPRQMRDPAALEGAYRLMNNQQVTLQALLEPVYQRTRASCMGHPVILLVNDQTELDYTFHKSKSGLGPIGNEKGRGLLMHSTLAIDPHTREVIGLSYVQIYLRQSAPKPRPKWSGSDEGRCWENAARAIGPAPEGCTWVEVSDAGSDYFDYLVASLDVGNQFLVRVSRDRRLTWGEEEPQGEQAEAQKLIGYARSLDGEAGSEHAVELPGRKGQPGRSALVRMAWAKVSLSPSPQALPETRQHAPIPAWVLRVWEPDPPEGVEGLEWILLSSLPVMNVSEADERVDWYSCRWFCEDYHQCLKTGCQVERSQLDEREDLENLIGFAAPIAVRLLQLRQAARQRPEHLAQDVVEPLMVEVLAQRQKIASKTMTIETFWRQVARLGGFQGRKSDGSPGWRIIWQGWRYLSDLTDGARLFLNSNGTKM